VNKFKVGDRVKSKSYITPARFANLTGSVIKVGDGQLLIVPDGEDDQVRFEYNEVDPLNKSDATDPHYYTFGDVEVRQISGHLTSFAGQAVQYLCRSSRLDGQNKGDAVEDLRKSIKFIQWEIERLEAGN
jgi:hypothetical protein